MSVRCNLECTSPADLVGERSLGFHVEVMDDSLSCLKFLAGNMEVSLEAVIASIVVNDLERITNAIYGVGGLSGNCN